MTQSVRPGPGRTSRGFTLVEVVIVVGLLATFVTLVVPPIMNSMSLVARESAMLHMDRDGHRALNLISADLRPSVLPVLTRERKDVIPAGSPRITEWGQENGDISFQDVLNSAKGFDRYGEEWKRVLELGTDFLPFTRPVPFPYSPTQTSKDTMDSNFLLQLGMQDFTGAISLAGTYTVVPTTVSSGGTDVAARYRYLRDDQGEFQEIHPYLRLLDPVVFGLDPDGLPNAIDLTDSRFDETLAVPNGADRSFGLLRFVPFRDAAGNVRVITETEFGMDLSGDGDADDSFALGRLEMMYYIQEYGDAAPRLVTRPAATSTVLMQTNTTDAAGNDYPAMFRLRGPEKGRGSYAIDINLLLMDDLRQKSRVLAFNHAVPFIVRRYQTTVELRNLTRR